MKVKELEQIRARLQADMAAFDVAWKIHGNRMIGATSPFPDEAFSSWCERLSLQFNVRRDLILERLGVQTPASWVDKGRTELDVQKATCLTGVSPERLAAFNAATNTLMREPQYAYMTSCPLAQKSTYRYCGQCFLEDEVPYGRRLWRLSFAHICPKHRTILYDKCPNCDHRIANGYSGKKRTASLRTCCSCNYNLGAATPKFLPERDTLIMLRRQAWWVKFLSALGSFQNGPEYWYGDYDPSWVHEEVGQLRGVVDGPFCDLIFRSAGRRFPPVGDRLILAKGTLEYMFEKNNPYFHRPKDLEHDRIPWWRVYLGGEYATIRNGHVIANALSECHDLTLGSDLWHMRKNVAIPEDLTDFVRRMALNTYRWLYPSSARAMRNAA